MPGTVPGLGGPGPEALSITVQHVRKHVSVQSSSPNICMHLQIHLQMHMLKVLCHCCFFVNIVQHVVHTEPSRQTHAQCTNIKYKICSQTENIQVCSHIQEQIYKVKRCALILSTVVTFSTQALSTPSTVIASPQHICT